MSSASRDYSFVHLSLSLSFFSADKAGFSFYRTNANDTESRRRDRDDSVIYSEGDGTL